MITFEYSKTLHDVLDDAVQPIGPIVYALTLNAQVFYVGAAADIDIEVANTVASAVHKDITVLNEAAEFLRARIGDVHIVVEFLVDAAATKTMTPEQQVAEYVQLLKADGHPVVNRDPNAAPVEAPAPKPRRVRVGSSGGTEKAPRTPRPNKGGGWGVNYDDYGKGLTVKTKSPIDGVFWIADHDKLIDKINESLLSKGKVPIGPTKKRYGASAGVRPGMFQPEA